MIARDSKGNWVKWPGDLAYKDGGWRLVALDVPLANGKQNFMVEFVASTVTLRAMTLEEAKKEMQKLKTHEQSASA